MKVCEFYRLIITSSICIGQVMDATCRHLEITHVILSEAKDLCVRRARSARCAQDDKHYLQMSLRHVCLSRMGLGRSPHGSVRGEKGSQEKKSDQAQNRQESNDKKHPSTKSSSEGQQPSKDRLQSDPIDQKQCSEKASA